MEFPSFKNGVNPKSLTVPELFSVDVIALQRMVSVDVSGNMFSLRNLSRDALKTG